MSATAEELRAGTEPTTAPPAPADQARPRPGRFREAVTAQLRPRNLLIWLLRTGVFVGFIGLWTAAVNQGWVDEFFVSRPSAVWDTLVDYFRTGDVWRHGSVTVRSTIYGFVSGSVGGVLVGLMFARFPLLDKVFSPYLAALNAMPRVALAPLFILWFGIGSSSKVWFAFSLVFFIVLINTEAGIKGVDQELTTSARVMGANEWELFTKVIFPAAVPTIFAGLRLGFVYALLGVVFGEMLASREGLGQQITFYAGTYRMHGVLATLVILSAISIVLNAVIVRLQTWLLRWQ